MTTEPVDSDLLDEYDDESEVFEEEERDNNELVAGLSGWGISLISHGLIAFVLMYIYIVGELERERPPVKLTQIEPPIEEEEKEIIEERTLEDVDVEVEADEIVEDPIVTDLDLPVEENETEDDEIAEVEEPKGREEAVSDAEAGGQAAFMAIGAGGGAKGAFGNRKGGGKKRAIGRNGGSRRSESAVEAALRWFRRHQSPDGSWMVTTYPDNCTDNPKCEPGDVEHGSVIDADLGSTGYALLCFLGAGYDHRTPNRYRKVVQTGLQWLQEQQKESGVWGDRNYAHAIATMAMVEAYAMTSDPAIRQSAQKAVDVLLDRQIKDDAVSPYGLGWDYVSSASRNDSSVTGWATMALKSAAAGGLAVGEGMTGAKAWMEGAWKAANPGWEKLDPYGVSDFPYVWNQKTNDYEHTFKSKNMQRGGDRDCAPIGVLCGAFLGYKPGNVMMETLLNHVSKHMTPKSYPLNTYYLYYNTLGVFMAGGDRWKAWNDSTRDMLVDAQRRGDGCFDGSWDWQDTVFPGHKTGRLISTAYCCLSLEVYYRYVRVHK